MIPLLGLLGLYDTASGQVFANAPVIRSLVPWWDWKAWVILLLLVALFAGMEGAYRSVSRLKSELDSEITKRKEAESALLPKEAPLTVGATLKSVEVGGSLLQVLSGYREGDKRVTVDVILAPQHDVTIDRLALDVWGEKLPGKVWKAYPDFGMIEPTPTTLSKTETFSVVFDVPKELAHDTKKARIYVLTGNQEPVFSGEFPIEFSKVVKDIPQL